MSMDLEAEARKVAEEIRTALPPNFVTPQKFKAVSVPILLAFADRVREQRDDHWIQEARRSFEGVRGREDMHVGGFTDLACFVLHEVWKRDPRVAPVLARAEAAEAEVERLKAQLAEVDRVRLEIGLLRDENERQKQDLKQLNSRVSSLERVNFPLLDGPK